MGNGEQRHRPLRRKWRGERAWGGGHVAELGLVRDVRCRRRGLAARMRGPLLWWRARARAGRAEAAPGSARLFRRRPHGRGGRCVAVVGWVRPSLLRGLVCSVVTPGRGWEGGGRGAEAWPGLRPGGEAGSAAVRRRSLGWGKTAGGQRLQGLFQGQVRVTWPEAACAARAGRCLPPAEMVRAPQTPPALPTPRVLLRP